MTASALFDACPSCPPGDFPAVLPHKVEREDSGSLRASYQHPACGYEWDCWWDPEDAGWPAGRDPVPFGDLLADWRAELGEAS